MKKFLSPFIAASAIAIGWGSPAWSSLPAPGSYDDNGAQPGSGSSADMAIVTDARQVMATIEERLAARGIDMDPYLLRRGFRELRLALLGPKIGGGFVYARKNGEISPSYEVAYQTYLKPDPVTSEQVITVTLRHYADLRLTIPKLRNLYHENSEVLVKWIQVSSPAQPNRPKLEFYRWMKPGENYTLVLPQEEDSLTIQMAVSAAKEAYGKASLMIEGRAFGYTLLDTNPFLPQMHQIARLEGFPTGPLRQVTLDDIRSTLAKVKDALTVKQTINLPENSDWRPGSDEQWSPGYAEVPPDFIPGETEPPHSLPPSNSVLLNRLRYIQSLMNGSEDEKLKGREELSKFITELESSDGGAMEPIGGYADPPPPLPPAPDGGW